MVVRIENNLCQVLGINNTVKVTVVRVFIVNPNILNPPAAVNGFPVNLPDILAESNGTERLVTVEGIFVDDGNGL